MVARPWLVRPIGLLCGASLSSLGCGKAEKVTSSTPDAALARLVPAAPPAVVASSGWLVKNVDGTYAINPSAECVSLLASSPPELALAPLSRARGVVATLLSKDTVAIAPLGLRAKLPPGPSDPAWVRVAPAGIGILRESDREWESAYAELLNRALPFESLVFHMSEAPWREMSNVDGLSARLYAVTESVDETVKNLTARLPAVAARVACKNHRGASLQEGSLANVTTGERGPWKTVRTTMSLYFSDYGGSAVVELFVRRVETVTVVLAFMIEGDSHARDRSALAEALGKP